MAPKEDMDWFWRKKSWGGENKLVALPRSCRFLNSALAIKATEVCPGLFKTPPCSFVVFALRSSLHLQSVTPCRKYKLPHSQKAVHFFLQTLLSISNSGTQEFVDKLRPVWQVAHRNLWLHSAMFHIVCIEKKSIFVNSVCNDPLG